MSLFHAKLYNSPKHPQDVWWRRIWNDPYLDWTLLLVTVMVLSIAFVGIGFVRNTTVRTQTSAPLNLSASNQQLLFDTQELSRILNIFDDRARENAAIVKGYTGVADPSL